MTVEALLTQLNQHYPQWQPQDAVKALYQRFFGCGHLIADEALSLNRLQAEVRSLPPHTVSFWEPLGNGWGRFYLSPEPDAVPLLSQLNRMFSQSAAHPAADPALFEAALDTLLRMAQMGAFTFSAEDTASYLTDYRAAGCPCVSHSPQYRAAYQPAYRVLREEWYRCLSLLKPIEEGLSTHPIFIVALDGPAASGKSTTAAALADLLSAPVIAMDDFFPTPVLRAQKQRSEKDPSVWTGGNIDSERFEAEVWTGLASGTAFSYRIFDCSRGGFAGRRCIPASRLYIIEGSYSHHPLWRDRLNLRVFLTVSPEEQVWRILARSDPETLQMFQQRWIPMENTYFAHCRVAEDAHILL